MLVYVGTLLPFRVCFLDVQVPEPEEVTLFWVIAGSIIDAFFWMDLILHFFFSYRDHHEREIDSIPRIAKQYICSTFAVDLISCLPVQLFQVLAEALFDDSTNTWSRLKRLPRIVKLLRLFRIAKVFAFVWHSEKWERVRGYATVRIANVFIGFFLVAHLLACGWYLMASMHDDIEVTWIYRRQLDGADIFEEGPFLQWIHAIYFVITVFTTVGFGDMSAYTSGEMLYTVFVMLVGAMVNAIITGEVINAIANSDVAAKQRKDQACLLRDFAKQTQLDEAVALQMQRFITSMRNVHQNYNREQVRQLILKSVFPRGLEGQLPQALFKGKLVNNLFLKRCGRNPPIRLSLHLAVMLHQRILLNGDFVYYRGDQPSGIHLVLSGVFAAIEIRRKSSSRDQRHSVHMKRVSNRLEDLEAVNFAWVHQGVVNPGEYFPFHLFCRGTYFGDAEVCTGQDARRSSVRCESDGTMLVLDKHDLAELVAEYPVNFAYLHKAARLRSYRWDKKAKAVPPFVGYADLAAYIIQKQFFKSAAKAKHARPPTTPTTGTGLSFFVDAIIGNSPVPLKTVPSKLRKVEWSRPGLSPAHTPDALSPAKSSIQAPDATAMGSDSNGITNHNYGQLSSRTSRDLHAEVAQLNRQMGEVQDVLRLLLQQRLSTPKILCSI